MFRIDHPTAAGVLPPAAPAGDPGYFSDATPGVGTPTVVTNDWANGITEELMSILTAAGIAPVKDQYNQVLTAIQSIIGGSAVVGAGALHGLTLSNAAGFVTTRVAAQAGLCRDSTNGAGGILAAPMTKRLDAVWAVGDGNGGRLSGVLANGQTWNCFALINPLTGAVEAPCFDTSPTAPDLAGSGAAAAGFTKFRRLGAIVLEAATTSIREFIQTGDWFHYKTRAVDYAAQANGGGVAYFRSVAVPVGIRVRARFYFQSSGGTAAPYLSGIFDPAFGAPAAFGGATQWAQVRRVSALDALSSPYSYGTVIAEQFTDTTGHIYTFSSDNAGDVIALGVLGWEDQRGRFY